MSIENAQEEARKILLDLGGNDLIEGIPNAVDKAITYVPYYPGQPNIACFFLDVLLADQYGKLSAQSKSYSSNVGIVMPVFATKTMEDKIAHVKDAVSRALVALKASIAEGCSVKIHENSPLGEVLGAA